MPPQDLPPVVRSAPPRPERSLVEAGHFDNGRMPAWAILVVAASLAAARGARMERVESRWTYWCTACSGPTLTLLADGSIWGGNGIGLQPGATWSHDGDTLRLRGYLGRDADCTIAEDGQSFEGRDGDGPVRGKRLGLAP